MGKTRTGQGREGKGVGGTKRKGGALQENEPGRKPLIDGLPETEGIKCRKRDHTNMIASIMLTIQVNGQPTFSAEAMY